ncbi:MAG: hypothetical protein Fur0018_12380 [Anaerolineales bacterium]
MSRHDDFAMFLLQAAGIEYARCDDNLCIQSCSSNLRRWAWPAATTTLTEQSIYDLFPEFIGLEAELQAIASGQRRDSLRIERIYRQDADGQPAYLTLEAAHQAGGLVLMAFDATAEGLLEQRITQTRNELYLLSEQLQQSSARLNTLIRRFVPSAVVDEMLYDERKALPGGERREISVVFADVRNFTRWAEARPPETVLAMLNHLWSIVLAITAEYGGTINQFMGDGVMIMFNAPEPHPDHAVQALRCARALANLKSMDSDLRFGVGVNTGEVVVGNIGAQERLSYTAIGTTTNVAHRLQSIAQPGQVILGPRTHQLAGEQVRCLPLEAVQLKGLSAPLQAFTLAD